MTPRVIAGAWRGRPLLVPPGDSTRPTSARAREALFSMLTSRIGSFEGLQVLDLFAGSGAFGIEALSRGAAFARFVERDAEAVRAIRSNLGALGAEAQGAVLVADAAKLGAAPGLHHLVFVDPPYGAGLVAPTLLALRNGGWLAPHAWVAVETARAEAPPHGAEAERVHGLARISLLRCAS